MFRTGWTPLIFMVSRSNIEGVHRLLDAGADVNKAENDGWSPLVMSAELGNLELVQVV
jgi:ankyrin repeat protein